MTARNSKGPPRNPNRDQPVTQTVTPRNPNREARNSNREASERTKPKGAKPVIQAEYPHNPNKTTFLSWSMPITEAVCSSTYGASREGTGARNPNRVGFPEESPGIDSPCPRPTSLKTASRRLRTWGAITQSGQVRNRWLPSAGAGPYPGPLKIHQFRFMLLFPALGPFALAPHSGWGRERRGRGQGG